jgi:hypothetical protein
MYQRVLDAYDRVLGPKQEATLAAVIRLGLDSMTLEKSVGSEAL